MVARTCGISGRSCLEPCRSCRSCQRPRSVDAQRPRSVHAPRREGLPAKARGQSGMEWEMSVEGSMELLGIEELQDRASLRSAYYDRIRTLHPDVNPNDDTTWKAAAVNAAYTLLMQELDSGGKRKDRRVASPFRRCKSAPSELFVNPFACGADPLMWRELQAVARSAADPADALLQQGVRAAPGTVNFLTAEQLAAVEEMMEEMEAGFTFEVTNWVLSDALLLASRTNGFRSR